MSSQHTSSSRYILYTCEGVAEGSVEDVLMSMGIPSTNFGGELVEERILRMILTSIVLLVYIAV